MLDADMAISESNEKAARQTVLAMANAGQLRGIDNAIVSAFMSLARAVDAHPENANLWRQYVHVAEVLSDIAGKTGGQDETERLISDMRAAVRDEKKPQAAKPRASGRSDRGAAGNAADAVATDARRRRPRTPRGR